LGHLKDEAAQPALDLLPQSSGHSRGQCYQRRLPTAASTVSAAPYSFGRSSPCPARHRRPHPCPSRGIGRTVGGQARPPRGSGTGSMPCGPSPEEPLCMNTRLSPSGTPNRERLTDRKKERKKERGVSIELADQDRCGGMRRGSTGLGREAPHRQSAPSPGGQALRRSPRQGTPPGEYQVGR
jgi:hypothetical protein